MENTVEYLLWERIPAEGRAEVDRLITAGRNIPAIQAMRQHAGAPTPELRDCIDLLNLRFLALGRNREDDAG
ncbi:hypothetical protein [Kitasatospora sp. NPDC057500]|uniref:hypothetical protein n=1 Tax=Kitasatospora sp. NPDC057500 TaxID=3346151 RepID=UPI0036CD1C31